MVALDWAEVVWSTTWPLETIGWAFDKAGYPWLRFRHLGPDGIFNKFEALRADFERGTSS